MQMNVSNFARESVSLSGSTRQHRSCWRSVRVCVHNMKHNVDKRTDTTSNTARAWLTHSRCVDGVYIPAARMGTRTHTRTQTKAHTYTGIYDMRS